MNITHLQDAIRQQDRFGRQIAARLTLGTAELPYEISERLRAARAQAMARRKKLVSVQTAPSTLSNGSGTATLGSGDDGVSWWNRIASALPLLELVSVKERLWPQQWNRLVAIRIQPIVCFSQ